METKQPQNQVNEAAEQAAALKKAQTIKIAKYASVAVLAIVAVVLIYVFAVYKPAVESGNEAIGQADVALIEAEGDSAKLAEAFKKYEAVAQEFGQDAGNRANLMVAISHYANGEYEKCIESLNDFSNTGAIIDAGAESLKGDCYVNMKEYDKALDCYDDAISACDENPQLAPFFMAKQARIYNEKKEYAKELEVYETIKKEYPTYTGIEVDKYIQRAKTLAESNK